MSHAHCKSSRGDFPSLTLFLPPVLPSCPEFLFHSKPASPPRSVGEVKEWIKAPYCYLEWHEDTSRHLNLCQPICYVHLEEASVCLCHIDLSPLRFLTFLESKNKKRKKKTIMAQTEWGWGGICQCSRWGSKVECKCLSLSNPTRFISGTEKSVQGPQHFYFQLSGCHLSEMVKKKWNWIPTPGPSVCCEVIAVWSMRDGGV